MLSEKGIVAALALTVFLGSAAFLGGHSNAAAADGGPIAGQERIQDLGLFDAPEASYPSLAGYLETVEKRPVEEPAEEIDGHHFQPINLAELYVLASEGRLPDTVRRFVVRGFVHKESSLGPGSVAFVRFYSACCASEPLAVGVSVPALHLPDAVQGQWLRVYGELVRDPAALQAAAHQAASTPFLTLLDGWRFRPVRVEPIQKPGDPEIVAFHQEEPFLY